MIHRTNTIWQAAFAAIFVCLPLLKAQDVPAHGSRSRLPAWRWEDAFVTGNGRLGAMIFGNTAEDTVVANHCRLFLPLGNREIVPDLAAYVPELRRIIRGKGYEDAMRFFLDKAKEQGYPGIIPTDPYHPGLFIKILQPANGPIEDYERWANFATGEIVIRWRDRRGQFCRRLFVSRTDNLIALSLTGPAPCELRFPAIDQKLIESQQQTTADWVTWHNLYVKGKGGYDAAVRIIRKDRGRDTLVLMRIAPWKTPLASRQSQAWAYSPDNPDFKTPGVFRPVPALVENSVVAYATTSDAAALLPQLKDSLARVRGDYAALFAPHVMAHGALFNRVTLDLGGGADRAKTTEELLDLAAKGNCLPPALMEKMYDAGRYMLICSAGELPPNLQGIWNGSWQPAWSGDFTLDANVQAAMAAACSANLADLMEGYFRLMESFYPEWRLNARRIYGCRGVLANARASNTSLALHWGGWPGVFWTAGCGWLASFFTDYAEYTGDRVFLEQRCLPLLREIAEFYADFLADTDRDGHVEFLPSYNPETGCGRNAAMDIAVAREVLMKLIVHGDRESAKSRAALLAKLPPYPLTAKNELAEWPDGRLTRRTAIIRNSTVASRASIRCSRRMPHGARQRRRAFLRRSPAATEGGNNRRSAASNAASRRRISAWRRKLMGD